MRQPFLFARISGKSVDKSFLKEYYKRVYINAFT